MSKRTLAPITLDLGNGQRATLKLTLTIEHTATSAPAPDEEAIARDRRDALAAGYDTWTARIGTVAWPRFARALSPCLRTPDDMAMHAIVEVYHGHLASLPTRERGYQSNPEWLAKQWVSMRQIAAMPIQTDDGRLTRRGELLSQPQTI